MAHSHKAEKAYTKHHREDNHTHLVEMHVFRSRIYSSMFDGAGATNEVDIASTMLPLCVICDANKRAHLTFVVTERRLDIARRSLSVMTAEGLARRLACEKDLLETAEKIPDMEHEIAQVRLNYAFTLCLANRPELAMVEIEKVLPLVPFCMHELLEIPF